jgi:probable rRNA maturation factor
MDELEITVQKDVGHSDDTDIEWLEGALRRALLAGDVHKGSFSVTIVDDDSIARMNEEYLQHEGPTDVISFPLQLADGPPVGDIYLGAGQAARQAAENGVEPGHELLRLAIHGALHVLGMEHPEGPGRESSPMYQRQEELLSAALTDAEG